MGLCWNRDCGISWSAARCRYEKFQVSPNLHALSRSRTIASIFPEMYELALKSLPNSIFISLYLYTYLAYQSLGICPHKSVADSENLIPLAFLIVVSYYLYIYLVYKNQVIVWPDQLLVLEIWYLILTLIMSDFSDAQDRRLVQLVCIYERRRSKISWVQIARKMKGLSATKLSNRLKTLQNRHGKHVLRFPAWYFVKSQNKSKLRNPIL